LLLSEAHLAKGLEHHTKVEDRLSYSPLLLSVMSKPDQLLYTDDGWSEFTCIAATSADSLIQSDIY